MKPDSEQPPAVDGPAGISRRNVMTGVGAAVAGGLVAGVAGAPAAQAAGTGGVATGTAGTTVFEFVCELHQDGADFNGSGYLTDIAGLDRNSLFSDKNQRDEAHALFLASATGTLVARSVQGVVHALDIEGDLTISYLQAAGASWTDPQSFQHGNRIATYKLDLQDVLTVILPLTGIPTLNGQAKQTDAWSVRGNRFGYRGQALRFTATGLGNRTDAGGDDLTDAQARLAIAGSMIAV